jgi:hypothetical protein
MAIPHVYREAVFRLSGLPFILKTLGLINPIIKAKTAITVIIENNPFRNAMFISFESF